MSFAPERNNLLTPPELIDPARKPVLLPLKQRTELT